MFQEHSITSQTQLSLNTEIRFLIASATVDKSTLISLKLDNCEDTDTERIRSCAIKVLRALKKEGLIQFFVVREGFDAESTEAVFLMNKYGEYIDEGFGREKIYVKL